MSMNWNNGNGLDFSDGVYTQGEFDYRDLRGANFSNSHLIKCDFRSANLAGAIFDGAKIDQSDFSNSRWENATAIGAEISDSDFKEAHVRRSNFSGARFKYTDFADASLIACDFSNSNFYIPGLQNTSLMDSILDFSIMYGGGAGGPSNWRGVSLWRFGGYNLEDIDPYHLPEGWSLIGNHLLGPGALVGPSYPADEFWFRDVEIRGVEFREIDFRGSEINDVNFSNCRFFDCSFQGANFAGTNFGTSHFYNWNSELSFSGSTVSGVIFPNFVRNLGGEAVSGRPMHLPHGYRFVDDSIVQASAK